MKWIVVAMILFGVPYTFLTLHFRKPGPSYEPYKDAREKTVIAREGFRRVSLSAVRSASGRTRDEQIPDAVVAASPGGLPAELSRSLLYSPLLPTVIERVSAAAFVDSGKPYSLMFVCATSDLHQAFSGARLYIKDNDAYLVPEFEKLSLDLTARSDRETVVIDIPPGTFDPGTYRLRVLGSGASSAWNFQVR